MNYNDDDIYPGMTEYPPERQGATEMTFCLVRFELSVFTRRFNFTAPGYDPCRTAEWTVKDKERMVDECHRRLKEKYLCFCDMSQPILWVTATVSRLILAKMWLSIHHPRSIGQTREASTFSPEVRDRLFMTSVEVIEFSHLLESTEKTAKWGWLFQTYMQWQSVAFILSELCVRPPGAEVDRGWRAIESVYDDQMLRNLKSQKGMLWKPLRLLMARATSKRNANAEEALRAKDLIFPDLPGSLPMQRFVEEYPDNMISHQLMAFGLDLDVEMSPEEIQQSVQNRDVPMSLSGLTKKQDSSTGTGSTWTVSGRVTGANEAKQSDYDISLRADDYAATAQPEAFSRYLFNVADQWF
jgi:hypothetical protein